MVAALRRGVLGMLVGDSNSVKVVLDQARNELKDFQEADHEYSFLALLIPEHLERMFVGTLVKFHVAFAITA